MRLISYRDRFSKMIAVDGFRLKKVSDISFSISSGRFIIRKDFPDGWKRIIARI
jgi:hypothetical protein